MGTSKGEEDAQTHEGEIEEELKKDETSGSLPTYQYSRVELMKIAERQAAKTRPACLSTEFNNSDGVWDPEKWVRSLQDSREASPLPGAEDRDRKRPGNVDREALRRKTSDPRERVKEDRDTIVLSPQRRSFGTGCHVSTSLSRQLSGGDYKESSERDRERREQRRIGSGRLNVDRDPRGGEREYRQIRFERDTGRFDRFRRDAEDRDRDKDRDRDRDIRDKRDFRSGFGGNSRRRQYNHHEEQPEWFTEGPTSQSDTIELRGFRGSSDDQKKKKRTEEEIEEEDAKEEARPDNKDKSNAVGVGDRNGSVETNDSSSPEAVQQGDSESKLFDFNTFFKLNDLPGLNPGDVSEATLESRFSRFFKGNSRENSRRSSFEGEFSFIHEMLDGKKSPGGASPTSPNGQQNFLPSYPMAVGEKPPSQPKSHASPLLQSLFLNNSSSSGDKGNGAPAPSFNIQDAEAQLKAMLLGGKKDSASSSGTASPASSSSNLMRKGKTVAELEAEIHHKTRETSEGLGERSGSSQSSREKNDDGDSSAFNKLLSLMKAGAAAPAAGAPDALRPPPMADDLRAISPGSRVSQPPHNEFMNALMRNKEQQLHLQQQSLQSQSLQSQSLSQLRLQQQALLQQAQQQQFLQQQQQQQQQQSFMQAHQNVMQQQHQQQQQQQHFANLHRGNPDGLAGFMNPSIITKPPSPATRLPTVLPTTPQMNSPTPSSIPAAFLAKQGQVQASSARVPSPIMFGQQPPSHLSAPSPIHPMPRPLSGQGQALAPNALGGPQSNMRAGRVLSPQDLVLHTQAIMHNALIKKQLEDQKERFMKKQQERARSPNVTNVAGGQARPASASSIPGTPTPGQSKPVSVAFTPTSVIKKMHSDRVSEKEKTTKTDGEGDNQELGQGKSDRKPGEKLPPLSGPVGDAAAREVVANRSNNTMQEGAKDGEGPRVNGPASSQSLLKLPGSAVEPGQQADHNVNSAPSMQAGSDPASMEFCLTQHNQGQVLVNQLMGLGGSDKPKQARALVGQGAMQNAPSAAQNQQPPMQGRPIVKAAAPPIPPSSSPNPSSMNPSSLPRPLMGASVSRADVPGQRPIIGTGGGGGMGAGGAGVGAAGQASGGFSVDINKLMEQQRLLQQARQAVNPPLSVRPPMVSSAPFSMPITGRMPLQAGVVPPTTAQQAAASNALLMQQMIQAGRGEAGCEQLRPGRARPFNQLNQLHPFNQMAARQAAQQQRMVDPRLQLQGVRGFNGPLSPNRPGFVPFSALGQNANNNSANTTNNNNNNSASASASKQGDSSILKWLSPDLVNQLPHLPPVPTPGHKVMTVDEIERSQQAVKN